MDGVGVCARTEGFSRDERDASALFNYLTVCFAASLSLDLVQREIRSDDEEKMMMMIQKVDDDERLRLWLT